jgi:hypothetical protein
MDFLLPSDLRTFPLKITHLAIFCLSEESCGARPTGQYKEIRQQELVGFSKTYTGGAAASSRGDAIMMKLLIRKDNLLRTKQEPLGFSK